MKKINSLINTWFVLMLLVSITARAQNARLTGELKGFSGGMVKLVYNGQSKTDSIKVKNGKFTWKGNLDEPQQVYLTMPNKYYVFFFQPGNARLTGLKDSLQTYKVTGSPIQLESEAFDASVKELTEQQGTLYARYGTAAPDEQVTIDKQLEKLRKQKQIIADKFITDHRQSYYSMYLIAGSASYGFDYSEVKPRFDMLDDFAKQTETGKRIAKRLAILERSRIGAQMIDFTQNDTLGNPVKFSSFKGKYVLVDFWTSWCGPCRAENPNVLKAYNAYQDKNFTVIGISLDEKADNWKKAIKDDKMPWTELSDIRGWKNEVSGYYGIQGIPSNLLVDPSGKIIAKDLRGVMLENKLKELLD
ncbi:AhpC/TSA family protein [Mucilaginibacter corticis]|uniref:AhpC/TSA family protein n=1 Tax=Mucilaginibacter corticis TaxID=2597670 RepID=A0A556ML09_9SPHI|nr:TlpA disulfide reductase family protein [Mucilaginibacter corticis]TSJ40532.1 AhpC/TSA family protein [Mucilaginibacter corticis]